MKYLLDVNVLVAWGWADHVDHGRTVNWLAGEKRRRGVKFFTSAIPEIGFVRVSVARGLGQVSVAEAAEVLRGMLASMGRHWEFLPDDVGGTKWPEWCVAAGRTTDAHLLELATRHGMTLATLDAEIPGAFLLGR